jgi:hypothetical protein
MLIEQEKFSGLHQVLIEDGRDRNWVVVGVNAIHRH